MTHWSLLWAKITAGAAGDTEVVPAVAGRKIAVMGYVLMSTGDVNAKWNDGVDDLTGLLYPTTRGGAVAPIAPDHKFWFETAEGRPLNLNLSGSVAVGGHVLYQLK